MAIKDYMRRFAKTVQQSTVACSHFTGNELDGTLRTMSLDMIPFFGTHHIYTRLIKLTISDSNVCN